MCELTHFHISCRLVQFYTHRLTRSLMSVTHGSSYFSFLHKCKSRWSHSISQLKPIPSKEFSACRQFSCCRSVQKLESMFVKENSLFTVLSSSSSRVCHGVRPLVDPFRSHVSRSLFRGLPRFLLPVGE